MHIMSCLNIKKNISGEYVIAFLYLYFLLNVKLRIFIESYADKTTLKI